MEVPRITPADQQQGLFQQKVSKGTQCKSTPEQAWEETVYTVSSGNCCAMCLSFRQLKVIRVVCPQASFVEFKG